MVGYNVKRAAFSAIDKIGAALQQTTHIINMVEEEQRKNNEKYSLQKVKDALVYAPPGAYAKGMQLISRVENSKLAKIMQESQKENDEQFQKIGSFAKKAQDFARSEIDKMDQIRSAPYPRDENGDIRFEGLPAWKILDFKKEVELQSAEIKDIAKFENYVRNSGETLYGYLSEADRKSCLKAINGNILYEEWKAITEDIRRTNEAAFGRPDIDDRDFVSFVRDSEEPEL